MDSDAGWTDPVEGVDPPEREPGPTGMDWGEDEGPFYAWLPPEDRLWRHPSEGLRGESSLTVTPADQRHWVASLPRIAVRSTWAVALIAGLIGATTATGVGLATGLWPHNTTIVRPQLSATSAVSLASVGPEPTDWQAIDDSVAASVVTISVDGGAGPEIGSGVVWLQPTGTAAYIVTDRSLFARGLAAGYIGQTTVTFLSGESVTARLVGDDPLSGLAVLRISTTSATSSAVPATIGTLANLGDAGQVLAVGSRAVASLSTGSVSGEDRSVELTDGTDLDGLLAVTMPSLSPSAAGGPVIDQYGQVVGITLNLAPADTTDDALTFAVPIDSVSRLVPQIIDGAHLTHPWLGIADADDVPSVTAHKLGLSGGVQAGDVYPSSPAGRAGMQANDIITSLNGQAVTSTGQLMAQMSDCVPGDRVAITYMHDGRTVETMVRMGEEPEDS